MVTETFIQGAETKAGAWELAHEFAAQLRAMRLTPSHRVDVRPLSVNGKTQYVVWLIKDDEEKEPRNGKVQRVGPRPA